MISSNRGQSWSIDYATAMIIFIIAVVIVVGIINNTFEDRSFQDVTDDAQRLTETLISPGYPEGWDNTDVVRSGILFEGRLSERKLEELARMDYDTIKQTLPVTKDFFFVITDENGKIRPILALCGIGHSGFPMTTDVQTRERHVAYYTRSTGPSELQAWATVNDATEYIDDEIYDLLADAYRYGLIILEDPNLGDLVAATPNATRTAAELRESFIAASRLGPVFVITGSFGTPFLGADTLENRSNSSIIQVHDEPYFSLNDTAQLNTTAKTSLRFMNTITSGNLAPLIGAYHEQIIATAESNTTVARWQYEDSIIYYFPEAEGEYAESGVGVSWRGVLTAGLSAVRTTATINCTVEPELLDSEQLIKIDRLLAGPGVIRTLTAYVWE